MTAMRTEIDRMEEPIVLPKAPSELTSLGLYETVNWA